MQLLLGDFSHGRDVHVGYMHHISGADSLEGLTFWWHLNQEYLSSPLPIFSFIYKLLDSMKSPLLLLTYNSNVSLDYALYCGPGKKKNTRKMRNFLVFSKFGCVEQTPWFLHDPVGYSQMAWRWITQFGGAGNMHCPLSPSLELSVGQDVWT